MYDTKRRRVVKDWACARVPHTPLTVLVGGCVCAYTRARPNERGTLNRRTGGGAGLWSASPASEGSDFRVASWSMEAPVCHAAGSRFKEHCAYCCPPTHLSASEGGLQWDRPLVGLQAPACVASGGS